MLPAPYPYLLLLLPAAVLARDDFRTRRVDVVWLTALGGTVIGATWAAEGWRTMLLHAICNAVLLVLSGAVLVGYLRLRHLAVRHAFGGGDIIFLLAVTPLFAPAEFLRFLIAACIVALLWRACCGCRRRTIPFVGTAAVALAGWVALQFIGL